MNSLDISDAKNPDAAQGNERRLTTLTYQLPELPESPLDMGRVILLESVREFIQTSELEAWEDKESVILRAFLATPEEQAYCYDTLSATRQASVEKGVRIRDLAENQARLKSLDYWGRERGVADPANGRSRDRKTFVARDRVWHPHRSEVVVAPRHMRVEGCFHALDGLMAVPPDHEHLLEFDDKGNITREVSGYLTQVPLLIVPFPETVTLTDLCREIRMQLRRKLAKLRHEAFLHGLLPSAKPQLVRDELFDNNVVTLVITGFEKRHAECSNSKASTDIWMFLLQLVEEGINVTMCATPSVMSMFQHDDFRLAFPRAARLVNSLRHDSAAEYMSYFWGVIVGADVPMDARFVEYADDGLYQRELIKQYMVEFNRCVNRDGQSWQVALDKTKESLSGDMKQFQSIYRSALETGKINSIKANKYSDELPYGFVGQTVQIAKELD
ncbi:hypothetical protein [Cupriavidus sp. 8B]